MDRNRAFQNAVSAHRAVVEDGSFSNQQVAEQAMQEAKAAGFMHWQISDAARGFSNDDLHDHS
ncbi:hypothetical protein [Streptomyces sp. NBC_01373]|uniref:hypothetical protein n=1 Tax=Streptomyces sp. NBC_01373 TaxID=2903843 RepID=UPI00224D030B|nr:hypothetical protein [Streptomyces sp. NBC_01373]MCX4704393.1 hypothetical protein [Streptomyces sp. NBC_01373]MCX4707133.1 hypothetical protein [Streptomyces sp. NBC_01373]